MFDMIIADSVGLVYPTRMCPKLIELLNLLRILNVVAASTVIVLLRNLKVFGYRLVIKGGVFRLVQMYSNVFK